MFKVSDERLGELKSLAEAHQETTAQYDEYRAGLDEREAFYEQSEEAERKFEERSTMKIWTHAERWANDNTAGMDRVVETDAAIFAFDDWRADWEQDAETDTTGRLQKRFGLDRLLVFDKAFNLLAEVCGKNLTMRSSDMNVIA